jgi:hypothetical protein
MYAPPGLCPVLHDGRGQLMLNASSVGNLRPAKASCSGVPAWFAISMRPVWRMGLW